VQGAGGLEHPRQIQIAMRARAAPVHQRGLRRQQGFRHQHIDGEIGEIGELTGVPRSLHGIGGAPMIKWV